MARVLAAALLLLLPSACVGDQRTPALFGFTAASAGEQLALERRFLELPDPGRIREVHRELTRAPHPPGSARNRELAEWIAAEWRRAGLDDVEMVTQEAVVPASVEAELEMLQPRRWRASFHENRDRDESGAEGLGPAFHAFSASGEVTAPLVFVGHGKPSDYDWLASNGVHVTGRIVLVHATGEYSYRGLAAFEAERRGAAAVLICRDTGGDSKYRETRLERGSILYDFLLPGDPPGGGTRPTPLPRILSAPVSLADARVLLQSIGGRKAPSWWPRGLLQDPTTGPGGMIRIRVRNDDRRRSIVTVTGAMRGGTRPDDLVIVGNHRDAWTFGGVDPGTGTAALMELVRATATLRRGGWQPRRTILFASWDGEELGLTGSTDWVRRHAERLSRGAVAYLNVDSAASGRRFGAAASPSLRRVIAEAAETVPNPGSRVAVARRARDEAAADRGVTVQPAAGDLVQDRPGGGSDHVPFLFHAGVPSADLGFTGTYDAYHSIFDTHRYVNEDADPGFARTATVTSLLGVITLRLANGDVAPLDPEGMAESVRGFARELQPRARQALSPALDGFDKAVRRFAAQRAAALQAHDRELIHELDRRVVQLERAFLDARGLAGRSWYRHLVHAPSPSYQPQVLPGIEDATAAGDAERLAVEVARLNAALERAAAVLDGR